MNKLTVNVPTGRPAVARHTLQISLNRSVPAVTEDIDRSLFTYPSSSSQKNRVTPTMASSTNEFGTGTPRGPQTRGPAGAKIVDFGRNVELQPRGKFNVRGVGVGGFFPPVKLRTGTSGVRFSTSAGSARSCKSANHSSPAASPLNVELAPSKTSRTAGESERLDASSSADRDWSPTTSRSENLARTHTLQDRPGNPYYTRAAASRETLSIKESSPSPSPQAFKSGNHATTGISKSRTPDVRTGKDAAWVRSFKVKQRRNDRVKELMESKPAGLALTSPTMGSAVW